MATKAKARKAPSRRAKAAPRAKAVRKAKAAPRAKAASRAPKAPSRSAKSRGTTRRRKDDPPASRKEYEGLDGASFEGAASIEDSIHEVKSVMEKYTKMFSEMDGMVADSRRLAAAVRGGVSEAEREEMRREAVEGRTRALRKMDIGKVAVELCICMCQAIKAGADSAFRTYDEDPECSHDAYEEASFPLGMCIPVIAQLDTACKLVGRPSAIESVLENARKMEKNLRTIGGLDNGSVPSPCPGSEIHTGLNMHRLTANLLLAQAECAMEQYAAWMRHWDNRNESAIELIAELDSTGDLCIENDDWSTILKMARMAEGVKFPAPKTGCQCCGVKMAKGTKEKRCGSCDFRLTQDCYPCGWPDDTDECACRAEEERAKAKG